MIKVQAVLCLPAGTQELYQGTALPRSHKGSMSGFGTLEEVMSFLRHARDLTRGSLAGWLRTPAPA